MPEVTAQTILSSLALNTDYSYESRGCTYEFGLLDDGNAVVQAWRSDGSSIWEAYIAYQSDWRVIDLVRDARESQR